MIGFYENIYQKILIKFKGSNKFLVRGKLSWDLNRNRNQLGCRDRCKRKSILATEKLMYEDREKKVSMMFYFNSREEKYVVKQISQKKAVAIQM